MRRSFPHLERTALLVIDMQEYFRDIATSILEDLARVITAARRRSLPVIYTQHGHEHPETDAGMLGQWWDDLILVNSEEWSLLPEVDRRSTDKLIRKKRYSAFFGTDLEQHLRDQQVTDLIVSGVMTNLCCETTARDAFVRDFRVFFLVDGTATVNDTLHRASIKNLVFGFASPLSCAGLVEVLKSSAK